MLGDELSAIGDKSIIASPEITLGNDTMMSFKINFYYRNWEVKSNSDDYTVIEVAR